MFMIHSKGKVKKTKKTKPKKTDKYLVKAASSSSEDTSQAKGSFQRMDVKKDRSTASTGESSSPPEEGETWPRFDTKNMMGDESYATNKQIIDDDQQDDWMPIEKKRDSLSNET